MDIWVGHRLPIHTTAIGKDLVAYHSDDEILAILDLRGMEKKTKRSIVDPAKFLREAARVRKYGFAVDDEENAAGVRCIAAPIFDDSGTVVATLGTSSIIMHIDETHMPKIVELIKKAAEKVSLGMGYSSTRQPQRS